MAVSEKPAEATVRKAFGNDVEPFVVKTTYRHAGELADVPQEEIPTGSSLLKIINAARKNAALAKVKNEEFSKRAEAGDARFKAPTLENPDVALRTIMRALMAQNPELSEEDAEEGALTALGRSK